MLMTPWELFKQIRLAMKDPDRIGDVAAYKSELTKARASAEVEAQLDRVRGYRPRVDLEVLGRLPAGTFGREYARFMEANGLYPIRASNRIDDDMLARNAFTVRYAGIHDMVHVLTGFDASWPGEVGVWAFVGGQRFSRGFSFAAVMALLVAPFRCPLRLSQVWRNFRRGWAMGKRARLVLAERLEESLERGLDEVRTELHIQGANDGYLPTNSRSKGA